MSMKRGTAGSETGNQPQFPLNPNVLFLAYLLHLVLPAFFLLDVVTTWWRGQIALEPWGTDAFVGGLSAVWLVTGLGVLFLSRDQQGFVQRIYKPLLSIYAMYVMLIFIEAFAQATIGLTTSIPGLNAPGRSVMGPFDPNLYPGVHGTNIFTVNQLGPRGPCHRSISARTRLWR